MELKWIEDFLSLVETRSFSRSAEQRHVTQPAFSRRIRALESWIGTYLVDRTCSPPSLTPAGELFEIEAIELRSRIIKLRSQIHKKPAMYKKAVELILPQAFSPIAFFPWMIEIERHLDKFGISARVVNAPDQESVLSEGGWHLLLRYHHSSCPLEADLSGYERITLGQQLVRPYARAVRGRKPLFELPGRHNAPLPFLAYASGSYMRRVIGAILHQAPAYLVERYQSDTIERLKAMAMEGQGIAFLPESAVREELERRALTEAGDARWQVALDVCLYRHNDGSSSELDYIWARLKRGVESTPSIAACNSVSAKELIVMPDAGREGRAIAAL